MYEVAPYPDLGADLKDLSLALDPVLAELKSRPNVRFLDAGCGTGHNLVGVAKKYPSWECYDHRPVRRVVGHRWTAGATA